MIRRVLTLRNLVPVLLLASAVAFSTSAAADFSDAQREQLKNIAIETKRKTDRVRHELRSARMELHRVYQSYDLDERRARAAIERINSLQRQLLDIHLENQIQIRRLLDENQFRQMMGRVRGPGGMPPPPPDEVIADRLPDRRMVEGLGLSADQKQRVLAVVEPAAERNRVLENLRRDTREIMQLYSRYDLNVSAAERLINNIHSSQVQLSALNHKKQQELRRVLTRAQFEKLQEAISERLHSMMKRPGPRR